MSPKRGERAAPPALPGEYTIRFATNEAAKGWEELCRQAAANTRIAYEAIRADPCPRPKTDRQHRLRDDLASVSYGEKTLEQWQYEVTSGGRIWYAVDHESSAVWIRYAGTGHPKATDR